MDEITLTLNNPITEEQWDLITDVDMECTDRIWFHTKHGKEVEFVKRKKGKWIRHENAGSIEGYSIPSFECPECHDTTLDDTDFCPNCGCRCEG